MKILENKYGRFGVEVERKKTRKEYIGSSLGFKVDRDKDIESFRQFIKPECFNEFKNNINESNISHYEASVLNSEIFSKVKEMAYSSNWNISVADRCALVAFFEVDNLNIQLYMDFPTALSGNREGLELLDLLKNDLKERTKVLNRLSIFNPNAKLDKYGFGLILIPDLEIQYFALDKDDKIILVGPTNAFSNTLFEHSLFFIDSIKAIKEDIGSTYGLINEMQFKREDDKFTTWGFIYPDTDIGGPHPEWIGHFIR